MSDDQGPSGAARAKLNLSLRVLAREVSGFHQIETVFCAIDLADHIEISRAHSGVTLEVVTPVGTAGSTPDLGPADRNLAVRAARAFARTAGLDHGVHIRLTKQIPAGAGLGGGSTDAAAVLRLLNDMRPEPLPPGTMLALGAELGSDVPFFMSGAALALAWGRGERMMPLAALEPAHVVLLVPPERVSTADAYAALAAARSIEPASLHAPRTWNDIAAHATNDFEAIIFERHPRLGGIRQVLESLGARVARMTGTGSVIFGVFDDPAAARAAADRAVSAHPDIEAILTRTSSA